MKFQKTAIVLWITAMASPLAAQPLSPKGFQWEMIPELSDEFNAGSLDANK